MYFDELDLNDNVLDALYDMHFETCTPVQEQCIPEILKGNDVLGVAQTGTGKTAAYLLPILSKLDDGGYPKDTINCVIMSPTRELAQQIDQAMQGFGYYLNGISSLAIYGGNDGNRYEQELRSLSMGADVIIATPGRLLSHLTMGNADFSKVSFFVLDEADRMLDMGFSEDIKKIAKHLPPTCQTIMFSATMPEKIEELAKTLLKNPVEIKIAVSKPAEKIKQSAYVCYEDQKMGIIKDIFKQGDLKRVIIFSGKKQKVKLINRALQKMNINCGEMHSDLEQAQRDEIMYKFKSGQTDVLVATDIVARGIDIDDITMVINFDVPRDAEDYVHRIGRTARADRDGVAITFINEADIAYFKQIEKLLEKEIEKVELPAELGKGPEYKLPEKRNGRGRSNRDGRRDNRGGEGRKKQSEGNSQEKKENRNGRGNRNRRNNRNENNEGAKPETSAENAVEKTQSRSKRRKPRRTNADKQNARQPATPQETTATVSAPTDSSASTGNKEQRRRQKRRPQKPQARHTQTTRQQNEGKRQNAAPAPKKTESKLKSIISKPLKWLGLKK